jgi:thioredoxin 1
MSKLQVLYFGAPRCGPCKMFKPAFQEVVAQFDNIDVKIIDADENTSLTFKYAITSIPTVILVKDTVVLFRKAGVMSKLQLTEEIENHINE